MASVRTFVAVLLDAALKSRLGSEIERLRAVSTGVAWVAAENLHVTLKFLGAVDEARLAQIGPTLGHALRFPVFDVAVRGLGAFPSLTRPRVIWAGAAEGERLLGEIATAVDQALAPFGFPREARPFSAHVTLGRVRNPRRDPKLAEALGIAHALEFGTLRADRVSLMRSDLFSRGARYTELHAWPLAR